MTQLLPNGVKAVVAIASGKGGVGKSTIAVNLAVALAQQGQRIGLLDADIYGPSLPRMMGITAKPELTADKKLIPIEKFGVQCMSLGLLIDEDTPVVWRGPMVQGALQQLLRDVAWQDVELLLVDMPPGTGDVQLTLSQRTRMQGAIIVSTPQDIALIDARKGLLMFQKVAVPVLGIIENMSFFQCPHCQEISYIFSYGGAKKEAQRLHVPFLGAVPLDPIIREGGDRGVPAALSASTLYQPIAQLVKQALTIKTKTPPLIIQ